MIKVIIPNNNHAERQYIIDVFFDVFLGVSYEVQYKDVDHWCIKLPNLQISIDDSFFNNHLQDYSYLSVSNIPTTYVEDVCFGKKIIRVWGSGTYIKSPTSVHIGNDIFATSFFFLSQWEEKVLKKAKGLSGSDKLQEEELFLIRNKLYQRCIVNAYVELLRSILEEQNISTKQHQFSPILTHDVDRCYLSTERELCVNILQMLEQNEIAKAHRVLSDYLSYPLNYNPFDSFNTLMDIAESAGTKAHFYFKACQKGERGYTYAVDEKFVQQTIRNITKRGHYVGFHASENTYHASKQLQRELNRLFAVCNNLEKGGRTHSLLYDEKVYDELENLGFKYDSGVGFQYYDGFRTATCFAYPMFDIDRRVKRDIVQIPFDVMDSVSIRQKLAPDAFSTQITAIIQEVKKFNGIFVSNWHSNLFLVKGREEYVDVYKNMVNQLK